MAQTPRDTEADRILDMYGDDSIVPAMEMLERHFLVLHNRAQVLLALAGIIISTTGFSGRNIAGTNDVAKALVIAGVVMILIAAAIVCWGVLHLRWLTMQPGESVRSWLIASLAYRDYKTRCYRVALFILLIGLTAYVSAIMLMLLDPNAPTHPPR